MGQVVTVSVQASADTTQRIHLAGVLDTAWWICLRLPELDWMSSLALSSNRTLEVARAYLSEAVEGIKVAGAELWPKIDATSARGRQKVRRLLPWPGGSNLPGIGVNYDLDEFGRTRRSVELPAAGKDVQLEALRAAQWRIASDTASRPSRSRPHVPRSTSSRLFLPPISGRLAWYNPG